MKFRNFLRLDSSLLQVAYHFKNDESEELAITKVVKGNARPYVFSDTYGMSMKNGVTCSLERNAFSVADTSIVKSRADVTFLLVVVAGVALVITRPSSLNKRIAERT